METTLCNRMNAITIPFCTYEETISVALHAIGANEQLNKQTRIVLKPNLVNCSPHPVTTPPACIEAIAGYCRSCSDAEIVIAEGAGGADTWEAYEQLGYMDLSEKLGITLIDLDTEPTVQLKNPGNRYLKEIHLPACLIDAFLISVPVLKAHSMTGVTLSMKNMIGIAPARIYQGGAYKKSKLHGRNNNELHTTIVELNSFRKPDLCIIDATIGMAQAHLWGDICDPPVNQIVAGFDPVQVDASGAELLGVDWHDIGHISQANGVLGYVDINITDMFS